VQTFLGESLDLKAVGLAHLIQPKQIYYQRAGTPTVTMQTTLHQLINCPFAGITQRIYLETKVWELMALLIDQELALINQQPLPLKADDIERVYHARDILRQNHSSPPSLLNLARQVGLNDCTLKRGFRQVFGQTAFGYLHDYRIEQARRLLQEGNLNVTEAARSVGFANRSYFAAAFRKKYGVSPKHYLR
jgi:AraC-like DNA-binding protein